MKDGRRGGRSGSHHGRGGEGHHRAADGGVGVQAAHAPRQERRVDGGQPRVFEEIQSQKRLICLFDCDF